MRLLAVIILTLSSPPSGFAAVTVTAEPGTALLLGAGLIAVGAIRWGKNRKK